MMKAADYLRRAACTASVAVLSDRTDALLSLIGLLAVDICISSPSDQKERAEQILRLLEDV